MAPVEIALMVIFALWVFTTVFSITDRICKCVEKVATINQYGKAIDNGYKAKGTSDRSSGLDA